MGTCKGGWSLWEAEGEARCSNKVRGTEFSRPQSPVLGVRLSAWGDSPVSGRKGRAGAFLTLLCCECGWLGMIVARERVSGCTPAPFTHTHAQEESPL